MKTLIYLNSGNSSVMEAQVLELLDFINKNTDVFDKIILLQGYKNKQERSDLERKINKFSLEVIWFKTFPTDRLFRKITSCSLFRKLDKIIKGEFVIHVRGILYGVLVKQYLISRFLPMNLLIDVRGLNVEEIELYKNPLSLGDKRKINYYKYLYKEIVKPPHLLITTVSGSLKEHLVNYYNFDSNKVSVNPNICGEQFIFDNNDRKNIREELNIGDSDILFVCSSAGMGAWQQDHLIISDLLKYNYKILNLSRKFIDLPNVINKWVEFEDMPKYLSAADMAVLWRNNDIVNKTASPSKFSEFAVMGLYVVHNGTVQICTDYINTTGAGCITKEIDNEFDVQVLALEKRMEWIDNAKTIFSVKKITSSYLLLYNILLEKKV